MADESDPRLEARLRTALRAEADALPFTIRADQVADRLAERRRAGDRRRFAVIAAAAVFAVGAAAFGLSLSRIPGPAAVSPSPVTPSSSPEPSSTPSLAADCVPADDPATVPGLDFVDGTGALITSGDVVYERRSDGVTTGDPDGWVVPADRHPGVAGQRPGPGRGGRVRRRIEHPRGPDRRRRVGHRRGDRTAHRDVLSSAGRRRAAITSCSTSYQPATCSSTSRPPGTRRSPPRRSRRVSIDSERGRPPRADGHRSPRRRTVAPGAAPGRVDPVRAPHGRGAAPDELSAEIPTGTDAFDVTLDCIGSGTVTLDIDGVVWSFPCEGTSVTSAARGARRPLEVTASAEGDSACPGPSRGLRHAADPRRDVRAARPEAHRA